MIEFTVKNEDLKKALVLANTATGDTKNSIESHCLFEPDTQTLKILSTNKNTCISKAVIDISSTHMDQKHCFTADPTKLLSLIKMSKSDTMKFMYHPETTTLEIHASEEEDSFISLPSLDVSLFPSSIEENFNKAFKMKTIDAGIFMKGLEFTEGFISSGKNAGKFGNVFLSEGTLYSSNGDNQAGAYTTSEFTGLNDLIFPGSIIPQITNIITKLNFFEITIKTTSNTVIITSSDSKFSFGFSKVTATMPKIPITVEEPKEKGWEVDKNVLLKKISRLQVSGESGMGVELCFSSNKLDIVTKSERPSKESMLCKGTEESIFLADCWLTEKILSLFEGDSLSIYSGKSRITFFSKGIVEVQETQGLKSVPFCCSALMALAA